jgi:hypothetical protein
MSLKMTITLSRKIGEANDGANEASVTLELEADHNLVAEPGKLQERIRQLFGVLRTSMAEEWNTANSPDSALAEPGNQVMKRWSVDRLATPSQVKAIYAIIQAKRLNLVQILQDKFKVVRADKLSLRQASQLIDELNAMPKGRDE